MLLKYFFTSFLLQFRNENRIKLFVYRAIRPFYRTLPIQAEKRKIDKPKDWKIKKLAASTPLIPKNSEINNVQQDNSSQLECYDGLVIERYGDKLLIEEADGINDFEKIENNKKYTICSQKSSLTPFKIAVGDFVKWKYTSVADNQGVVVTVRERINSLQRPSVASNENKLELKTIASNINQIILVVAAVPLVPLSTIDKFIVGAHANDIETITIVINKCDLPNSDEYISALDHYRKIGYGIIKTSTKTNEGLSELMELLTNKTSIFVGQSGVGKSSLLNMILPETNAKIGDLVKHASIGSHTTSNARLYHLKNNGKIIDSPGIRELNVWHLSKDLIQLGFVEINSVIKNCKFRNCKHTEAEGKTCAVRNGVENGSISPDRYFSFMSLIK
jgi:ribosome biogenesis GTPase